MVELVATAAALTAAVAVLVTTGRRTQDASLASRLGLVFRTDPRLRVVSVTGGDVTLSLDAAGGLDGLDWALVDDFCDILVVNHPEGSGMVRKKKRGWVVTTPRPEPVVGMCGNIAACLNSRER